ncbi:hypothetical protein JW835_03415 [bacterium]|nr:hypothetical protein [bacterium]
MDRSPINMIGLFWIALFNLISALYAQSAIQFSYIATWGDKGNEAGQFLDPMGIDVDPMGFLYVADTGNQRIQKIDPRGRFVTEIGGFGWQAEQFDHPCAVWAGNGLDVFVADFNNHRIQRYDKDLHYLAAFRTDETWPENLEFGFPLDMALSSQGELFCLDGENQRVLKLDILGNPQRSFGDFDSGAGRLLTPQRLLITKDSRVLVSDREYHAIFVFDIHGNYLYRFGTSVLEWPQDMCEFPDGRIAVADVRSGLVVFDGRGRMLVCLKGSPKGGFLFKGIEDVAIHEHLLFVLDRQRHAVDVFEWKITGKDSF